MNLVTRIATALLQRSYFAPFALALGLSLPLGAAAATAGDSNDAKQAPLTGHAVHPPIGIGGGHTLPGGGVALGYAFQMDRYRGLRDGRRSQGADQARAQDGFETAPSHFDVERHEVALMWASSDRVTWMANLPIYKKKMRNASAAGDFVTRSQGPGDLELSVITRFMERENQRLYFGAQLGAPTGSIRKRGDTSFASATRGRLPYPMQLGSGSWHLKTSLTYEGRQPIGTWGAQASTLYYLNSNDLGYRQGNRFFTSMWFARRWADWVSTSVRVEWNKWGNVHEFDGGLAPENSPSSDPQRQAGQRLDFGAGLDLHLPFAHQSLAFEGVVPLVQKLDGPQVDLEYQLRAGWRLSF